MKILALILLVLLSGCGSIYVHTSEPSLLTPYRGTQFSVSQVTRSFNEPVIPGEVCVWTVDVLYSALLDTVLLPVDLAVAISR